MVDLIESTVMALDARPVNPPTHSELVAELDVIRREGITHLRDLDLPALAQAARASGQIDQDQTPDAPQIEATIRAGLADLDSGRVGSCAALLYGLEPGTRGDDPTQLRRDAAERWGVSEARFRRKPQQTIIAELADAILRSVHAHQQRLAHLALERRLPTTSRLAVEWLERFEAYYRLWSSASGLGADLTAYRATLIEPDRPFDRPAGTDSPDDPGYSQELHAAGYISYSLWHYTRYLTELQQFQRRHGGLWLLSDARAEEALADAVYRITWHSPNNEQDDSYLRLLHQQAGGELHSFRELLKTDRIGATIETDWMHWADQCKCTWDETAEVRNEHFPTHRHHPGIAANCQIHAVTRACNDYCTLIDDDWQRIADWYHLPSRPPDPSNDREMYLALPRTGLEEDKADRDYTYVDTARSQIESVRAPSSRNST